MKFDTGNQTTGPSVSEVQDYTIVTRDMVEKESEYTEADLHPADEELREFVRDVSAKRTAKTAERFYRGIKPMVCWLDIERNTPRPINASRSDVGDYLNWLANTRWSRNTRKSRFAACQRFYRFAHDEGWTDENLARGRSLEDYKLEAGDLEDSRGGFGRDEHKWIPRDDVVKLWQPENVTSPASRDSLIFKLMWYTTCRPEAITTMRYEPENSPGSEPTWHDPEEGWFRVRNLKRGDDEDDYRKVYYPTRLNSAINEWMHRRDALGPYGDSEYLFITHQQGEMRASHISRKVKEAAFNVNENVDREEDKIQEVSGYDVNGNPRWKITGKTIRHSALTWMVNRGGVDPVHAKAQAGHSKLETTMRYVHEDEQRRAEVLNQAWE